MSGPGNAEPSGGGVDPVLAAQRMVVRWEQLDQVGGRTGAILAAEATSLGVEALRRAGIEAVARTCGLAVYSPLAYELVRHGASRSSQWTDETCGGELSPVQVLHRLLGETHPPGGYALSAEGEGLSAAGSQSVSRYRAVFNPLHMVIEHQAFVADLAVGAFSREDLQVESAVWRRDSEIRPFHLGNALRWIVRGERDRPVVVLSPGPRLVFPQRSAGVLPSNVAETESLVDALEEAIRAAAPPSEADTTGGEGEG